MENGNKQKYVEDLRSRLNWFINEASEEEYSEEEVRAIRNLLRILESEELDETYYNPEKSLERFKATLDMRMRIRDEMQRLRNGEVTLLLSEYSNN